MQEADLEEVFLRLAIQRSQDLERNVSAANKAYGELHRLKNRMRLLPDKGEAMLKRISAYPNVEVQIVACAALLAVDEPFAVAALESIEQTSSGLASITASMTIREWQAGNLAEYWA